MTSPDTDHALSSEAQIYFQVQQFYSRQMRLLDSGSAEAWANTFTEDGVFHQNVATPLRGRAAIAVAARVRVEQIRADSKVRRHWLGMLEVIPQADGLVHTSYYALAMATPRGKSLQVYVSTDNRDVLANEDGRWLVKHRYVEHDGRVTEHSPVKAVPAASSLTGR
ncbi:nuclear transport factor 2 family protein [Jatrophihabitans lederbergiae]|uniref:Nuclear transport factor 2 family protein n=1 Tax=Jatrophihabitans lederbergiae TaxID=3075547 RepID=A0ABU2JIP3_9ACTN|nr:nuclear transport factor 2 family protein [Jatrophihabitans sp. DSM 44399]MDT0264364.1 nuclear transport factor 2 family protein [Jatrophihabitans sp. DSM 44399]